MDGNAEEFHEHRVVGDKGGLGGVEPGGGLVGASEGAEVKSLRRLYGPERFPGCRAGDQLGATAAPSPVVGSTVLTVSTTGITGMTAEAPAPSAAATRWKTDSGRQGAGGVMDQNGFNAGQECGHRGADRIGAAGSAVDHRHHGTRTPWPRQCGAAGSQLLRECLAQRPQLRISRRDGNADLPATPAAATPRRAWVRMLSPPRGTLAFGMP